MSTELANLISSPTSQLIDGLVSCGWAIVDDFISANLIHELSSHQLFLFMQGAFREAGVGATAHHQQDVRDDFICWWNPGDLSSTQKRIWSLYEELRLAFNETLYLNLSHSELHYARYAPGSSYARHCDQLKGSDQRVISTVLYLNSKWKMPDDGGALCLYPPGDKTIEVAPVAGRLVCFRSDTIEHEVLAPTRERLSLTGWLRRG